MARRADPIVASALALAAFLVYARTLAPSVLPGDSGELQFAAHLLGVAHPTGYPLYLLLGKIFSVLVPLGDAAYRLNLFSAVLSAGAVALVYLAGRQLQAGAAPSAAAAMVLAFGPTFWSQATRAEVYALNSLLMAGLLLCVLAATGPMGGRRWLWAVAAFFGLGLAHHRMMLLLAPAVAAYLWLNRRALGEFGRRRLAGMAAVVAAPLLLYLYIPLRAPATPYFRLPLASGQDIVAYDGSLQAAWLLLTGQGFQGLLSLVGLPERLLMAAGQLFQQFGAAGLLLALAGAAWLAARRPAQAVLLGLSFAAVVAFCVVYRIGDIADLFTPAYIFVALSVAVGMELVLGAVVRAWPEGVARSAAAAAMWLLPALLLTGNFVAADRSSDPTRAAWQAVLAEPIAQGAILVTNDRDEIMPLWYLQYAEGRRTDLLGLFPLITTEARFANVMRVVDTAQATGRPVYIIKDMPGLTLRYVYAREGRLYRVTETARVGQPERRVEADLQGEVRLLGADVGTAVGGACGKIAGVPYAGQDVTTRVVTVTLHWEGTGRAQADYQSFVHILDDQGNKIAQSDHRPGGVYYPTSMWQAGEALRDVHSLTVLAGGPYTLVAGMYRGDTMAALGQPAMLGTISP